MKKEISLIVPIYNSQDYLDDCIKSILNQSYPYFEAIMVDDGSTDNSLEICKKYCEKDKRIRFISIKNGGPSHAKNEGIKIAEGKYIAFCDSDDTVSPEYLKNLMDAPENIDLVVGGYNVRFLKTGECIRNIPLNEGCFSMDEKIAALNSMGNGGIINVDVGKRYKRQILVDNSVWFDHSLPTGEDLKFNCQYIELCEKIQLIQKSDYEYYRRDIGSQVSTYKENQIEISCKCIECVEKLSNAIGQSNEMNRFLPNFYLDYYMVCINNLYRPECKKSMRERISDVSQILEMAKKKLPMIKNVENLSYVQRIFVREVEKDSPVRTFWRYRLLFFARYCLNPIYLKMRKRIIQ